MATTGYKISASAQNATHYSHSLYATWFASRTSKWYMIAQDSSGSDNAIWVHDLATPGTPGDGGGWTLCQITGGSAVAYIHDKDTADVQIFWDDSIHMLHFYGTNSTTIYQQYTLETDGKWTRTLGNFATTEALPAGLVGDDAVQGQVLTDTRTDVVATTGVPWLVYYNVVSGKVEAISRSGASNWTTNAAVEIEGTAPALPANSRVSACRATIGGAPAIVAAYTYSGVAQIGSVNFAYRLDSAGLTDAWTKQAAHLLVSVDNHIAVRAVLLDGQTTSNIHVVWKAGTGEMFHTYRNAAGTWSSPVELNTSRSRPVLSYDATNHKLYLHYVGDAGNQTGPFIRQMSTNVDTVSWSAQSTFIEDDGTTANLADPVGPSHDVTYTMSPMVIACNQVGVMSWFNEIAILAPLPETPVLSSPADAALNQAVSLTCSWAAATYATTYDLQVATDAGFTSVVASHTGLAGTSQAVSGLSNGVTYYWRVRGVNSTGNGSYATARTFTTVLLSASKRRRVMLGVG